MVYRDISMRVRRRFPTMRCLIEAGFLFENELRELEFSMEGGYNKYWVPVNWANSIVWRMQEVIGTDKTYDKRDVSAKVHRGSSFHE